VALLVSCAACSEQSAGGDDRYQRLLEEIDARATDRTFLPVTLARELLEPEGFAVDWLEEHEHLMHSGLAGRGLLGEIHLESQPGVFEFCVEGECHQMALRSDGGPQILRDGDVVLDMVVEAPDGVEVVGAWCAGSTGVVFGYLGASEIGRVEGLVSSESSHDPKRPFRIRLDLDERGPNPGDDGWLVACGPSLESP